METASQQTTAEELGKKAFESGKTRVPALDSELMKMIGKNKAGESVETLKAWLRGWDNAHLAKTRNIVKSN